MAEEQEFSERRVGRITFKDAKGEYIYVGFAKRNKWGGINIDICTRGGSGWSRGSEITFEDGSKVKLDRFIRFYPEADVTIAIPDEE